MILPFTRVLVVVFLVAAALYVLARTVVHHMIYPGCPVVFPSPRELSARYPDARLLSYATDGGFDLEAAWFEADARVFPGGSACSPAVLFFHGNGESAAQSLDLADALWRRGISVLLAEYRGYGGMPGRPSERALVNDAEGALELLRSRGVALGRMVFVGRSLGTGVAAALALRHAPALLILVSPYTSLVDLGRRIAGPIAPWMTSDRFDTASRIGQIACPIVIIHGTADEVVPFEMGERLARASRAALIPLEGRGHNDLEGLSAILAGQVEKRFALTSVPGG